MKKTLTIALLAAMVIALSTACVLAAGASRTGFRFHDTSGSNLDLLLDGRLVTRFMYGYDESSDQRRFETYKPFLHVFSPEGQRLTNGPDITGEYTQKSILYPHHRGIFIGWNKVAHAGKTVDLWHMKGVEQVHQKFLQLDAGPNSATTVALINWRDTDDKPLIVEQRKTTVYRTAKPGDIMIDFTSTLKPAQGDITLGGDPEHAGFHYRPHNAVAKGPKEGKAKYLYHKDGIDAHKDENLPWVGMSYSIDGKRYSVLHMNHPDNPTPSKYSAYRDYGRFGMFFAKKVPAGQSLTVKYRILVTEGELPSRQVAQARYNQFVSGS